MKKLFIIIIIIINATGLFSQKITYCEATVVSVPLQKSYYGVVNYGNDVKTWIALKDKNGKKIKFNNKISMLNYMSNLDWEYVDVYKGENGNILFLLKKQKSKQPPEK